MKNFSIDDGISKDSIKEMIYCFKPEIKVYYEGETIMCYSDNITKIGVIFAGNAVLYTIDKNGGYQELERYKVKDVFGKFFYLPIDNLEYIIEAITYTKVMFIDYKHIITPCTKICEHHSQLIDNLFHMTARKVRLLSLHLNILSQNTIRKKLFTYLKYIQNTSKSDSFTIPMSLINLAGYLCIDRSAMMREIGNLKKEGVISSQGTTFSVLKKDL
ncbi:MAG: Crp/Fnr family transcriptional regulator [Fusobacteriaceae bacterium]|jgi:CRP-like cAMP-binding protein|nr:Crp/Fnr family transcriptional regulator [Fusobacteriaceae bacterium]